MGGRGIKAGAATLPSIGHRTRWRGGIGFGDEGAAAAPFWWSRAPDPRDKFDEKYEMDYYNVLDLGGYQ